MNSGQAKKASSAAQDRDALERGVLKLADAYADASFTQGLDRRTEDPAPERARQSLVTEVRRLIAMALPNGGACEYCDGTGDVHGLDGEWRGSCKCEAAQAAGDQVAARSIKAAEVMRHASEKGLSFQEALKELKRANRG